jgi:hypothetical protein
MDHPGLEHCHGFAVLAGDRPIGSVETPLFPESARHPDFLVIRTASEIPGTFRIVSTSVIGAIDTGAGMVQLDLAAEEITSLPQYLPLVHGRRGPQQ